MLVGPFSVPFSIKVQGQNRYQNRCRTSYENYEKTCDNDSEMDAKLNSFGKAVSRKIKLSEQMDVRKPYDSCSRIRVGEGSPKTKEIK